MVNILLLLASVLIAGELAVTVRPVDGPVFDAQWLAVDTDGVELLVDGRQQSVPWDQLQSLSRQQPAAGIPIATRVFLRDGSQLPVDQVTLSGEFANLKLRRQASLQVPVRQLAIIRFRSPAARVEQQWAGLVKQQADEDRLVILRGTDTLDSAGGIIQSISAEQVVFDLGGSPVEAPINRLEGVLFGGPEPLQPQPRLRLHDIYGGTWFVDRLLPGEQAGALIVETRSGLQHPLSLDLIERIELASGVVYLSSLEPVEHTYQPYISIPAAIPTDLARQWLGMHVDPSTGDLMVPSRSLLTYRVEPGFSRFASRVQIDPGVRLGGRAVVRFRLGTPQAEPVWESELTIGEAAKDVEIMIGETSRLIMEVDFGGDSDIGDVVRMAAPRFLK